MNGYELYTKKPNTIDPKARVYFKTFFFDTNNDEVILQDQEAGLKKGNDPMYFYEGYEEKTEAYFRYIVGELESGKRIRVTPYGAQNSDITYLSAEQMLKTLE